MNYQGSITERIINAVLGIPPVHPLHKSACKECGEMVCKKDMQAHTADHVAMYEMVAQTERESYRHAH